MATAAPAHITGCILAGGQGSRLDGADKGLLELAGRPLIAHCIERLQPQVSDLMISANRNRADYLRYATRVFSDSDGDYPGPLAGFLGAMQHASGAWVVTVPCDSPFFPPDMVERLWQPLARGEAEIAVVRSGGRLQPVFALFSTALHDPLANFLARGERRIAAWFREHRTAEVDFEDVAAFANINTAAELSEAREHAERHDPVA